MTFTPITKGTLNWDVPLNAALAQLDSSTTAVLTSSLQAANNLSDLTNAATARANLGVSTQTVFNVKDYGAVGNGVTNDAAAIAAALNAMSSAGGGTVFFPAGTYLVGSPIAVPTVSGQIMGSGWNSIIKATNGLNDYVFKFSGTSTTMHFYDFTIEGNASNQTGGGGIYAIGSVECTFFNMHFTHCYDYGIYFGPITGGAFGHNNRVTNCLFDNGTSSAGKGAAILLTSNDENIILGCDFQFLGGTTAPIGSSSVAIYDTSGTNFFSSCNFVGGASGNNCVSIRIQDVSNSKIVGCNFDGTAGDSIFIAADNCVVSSNTIFSPGQVGTAGAASGVHLEFGANNNLVIGNALASSTTNGVTRSLIREENVGSSGSNIIHSNQLVTRGTMTTGALDVNAPNTITRGNIGGGTAGDNLSSIGSLILTAAGQGIKLTEGTNAKMGTAVLTAGSATVSTTAVTANSRIFLTNQALGGTAGFLRVGTITAGTSFTIVSSSGTDTSTIAWLIVDHT